VPTGTCVAPRRIHVIEDDEITIAAVTCASSIATDDLIRSPQPDDPVSLEETLAIP
jgi:hypothetical protein